MDDLSTCRKWHEKSSPQLQPLCRVAVWDGDEPPSLSRRVEVPRPFARDARRGPRPVWSPARTARNDHRCRQVDELIVLNLTEESHGDRSQWSRHINCYSLQGGNKEYRLEGQMFCAMWDIRTRTVLVMLFEILLVALAVEGGCGMCGR